MNRLGALRWMDFLTVFPMHPRDWRCRHGVTGILLYQGAAYVAAAEKEQIKPLSEANLAGSAQFRDLLQCYCTRKSDH